MTNSSFSRAKMGRRLGNKLLFLLGLLSAFGLASQSPVLAATFAVTSTTDSPDATPGDGACQTASSGGASCTLRAAIQESNALSGADTIGFNIPGGGVKTIAPVTALPTITEQVTIDGYTQPDSSRNTATSGTNAVLQVELTGANQLGVGLRLYADRSIVRGLSLYGWSEAAIDISFQESFSNNLDLPDAVRISGCFIGPRASGAMPTDARNGSGVRIAAPSSFFSLVGRAGSDNVIGGSEEFGGETALAQRNLLSGNDAAVTIEGGSRNAVLNNLIGTNKLGVAAAGTSNGDGAVIVEGSDHRVGAPGAGNLILGDGDGGDATSMVALGRLFANRPGPTGVRVQGNSIRNGTTGVDIVGASNNTIGGLGSGEANTISGHSNVGVSVSPNQALGGGTTAPATGNALTSNGIFGNVEGNIELLQQNVRGPNQNDAGDADSGANDLQNFPILTFARQGAGGTVSGTLNSLPNAAFTVQVYASEGVTRQGRGEGQTLVRTLLNVQTDAQGNATFGFDVPTLAPGQALSATATNAGNSTSEFGPVAGTGAVAPIAGNTLVWVSSPNDSTVPDLYLSNGDGTGRVRLTNGFGASQPALSPDGSKILFVSAGGIYLINAAPVSAQNPVVFMASGSDPTWHPSGTLFAFLSGAKLFAKPATPADEPRDTGLSNLQTPTFSPSGTLIAYVATRQNSVNIHLADFNAMTFAATGERFVTNNPVEETNPAWSPDGRFLAFGWNINDLAMIQVFDEGGNFTREGALQNSTNRIEFLTEQPSDNGFARKDDNPTWSRDGKNIAFQSSRETGNQRFRALYVIQARPEDATNPATRITELIAPGTSEDPAYAGARARSNRVLLSKRATTPSAADGKSVAPGQSITYIIRYENDTAGTLFNVLIEDGLPTGTRVRATRFSDADGNRVATPTGGDTTNNRTGNTSLSTLPTLAPGASGFISIETNVDATATAGTRFINGPFNATTTRGYRLSYATTATAPESARVVVGTGNMVDTRVIQPLVVTKTADKTSVNAGDALTYTLSYRNGTSANVTGATLTDTLPSGVAAESAANGTISTNKRTVTFALGTLAAGASGTRTLVARVGVDAASPVVNTVNFRAKDSAGAALEAGAQTSTSVVFLPIPNLSISKRVSIPANNAPVAPGGVITYVLTATNLPRSANRPTATARDLQVVDFLPTNTAFDSAFLGTPNAPITGPKPELLPNGIVSFRIGDLAVNATKSVTLLVRVAPTVPSGTVIRNSVYSVRQFSGDPFPSTGPAVETPVFRGVTGTIINTSNRAIRNVVVTALEPKTRQVAQITVAGPIAAGARTPYALSVPQAGNYVIFAFDADKTAFRESARRVSIGASNPGNVNFTGQAPDMARPAVPEIITPANGSTREQLTATAGKASDAESGISLVLVTLGRFEAGDPLPSQLYNGRTARFESVNAIEIAAQIGSLNPELLAKYAFVAYPPGLDSNGNPVSWITTLPNPGAGRYALAALAFDRARNNRQAVSILNVGEPRLTISKVVEGLAAGAGVRPGDTLSYLIRVRNEGSSVAAISSVVDKVPVGTSLISTQALNPTTLQAISDSRLISDNAQVFYDIGRFPPNESVAMRVTVRVNPNLLRSQPQIVNTATVVAATASGTSLDPVSATVSTPVQFAVLRPANPGVHVIGAASASSGESVTYTVVYSNSGDLPLANLVVRVETISAGTPLSNTFNIGTVAAGETGTRTFARTGTVGTDRPLTRTITPFYKADGIPEVRGGRTTTTIFRSRAQRSLLFRMGAGGKSAQTIQGQTTKIAQLQIGTAFIGGGSSSGAGSLLFPGKSGQMSSKVQRDLTLINEGSSGLSINGLDSIVTVNGVTITPTSSTDVVVFGPENLIATGVAPTIQGSNELYIGPADRVSIGITYRRPDNSNFTGVPIGVGQILENFGRGTPLDLAAYRPSASGRDGNFVLPLARLVVAKRRDVASRLVSADGRGLLLPDGTTLLFNRTTLIGTDAGSLIGTDAGSLIGTDAGSLIGQDGGSLIGQDGGSLIGQDGGSLIGQDAASLIGQDGGTIVAAGGGNIVAAGGGNIVAAGGGNIAQIVGGNIVAAGGGNIVAAGGGN